MFAFTKLSNIIRIRFTTKISFKMPKQGRHTDKGSPPIIVYLSQKDTVDLNSFYNFYEMELSKKTNRLAAQKDEENI